MQIGRYVLNNLENDLKTVAKEKEVVYNEFNTLIRESTTDSTEDREENKEETDYERDQLQPERRVSDSRYQHGRDERNDREVRNDEERSKEYGISVSAISRWIKLYSEVKVDDDIIMTAKQIKELQKRNAQLEEENIILKKALAIMTPHSGRE